MTPPPSEAPSGLFLCAGSSAWCPTSLFASQSSLLLLLLTFCSLCDLDVHPQSRDSRQSAHQCGRTSSSPNHNKGRCSPGAAGWFPLACVSEMLKTDNDTGCERFLLSWIVAICYSTKSDQEEKKKSCLFSEILALVASSALCDITQALTMIIGMKKK